MKYNCSLYLLLLLLLPTAGILFAAGCSTPAAKPTSIAQPPTPPPSNSFVGNQACAQCHTKEYQAHKASFHATTARLVSGIGKIVLPRSGLFGSRCRLRPDGSSFRISVGDSPIGAEKLQYGLGSDKAGITFVAIADQTNLFEMRASYFPGIAKWYSTPGQKNLEDDEMGLDFPPDKGRLCMSCHTTTLATDSIVPEPRFLGVGCEACHGPGGAHISAVKSHDPAHLQMDKLGGYGAEKLNTLCGRCHRTEQDIMKTSPSLVSETQRFQSYGIMKSRCFKESKDTLSCLTCHDPHKNATLDMGTYEKACLTCHSSAARKIGLSTAPSAKACPVSPQRGCIPCHMPARKIIPGADRSPSAADHFIHIPPKGSHPSPFRPL